MRVKKLSGIVTRLAAILLCLVLFSAHLASGMFAKYTSGASVNDSARVAKVQRIEVIEQEALTLDSVGNGTYKFLVKNHSETAFQYDIKLKITSTEAYVDYFGADEIAKTCYDVKVNGIEGTPSSDGSLYTFSMPDILKPDSESDVYTVTFKAFDLAYNVSNATNPITGFNVPIKFSVSAKGTQVN